jgi:hypothetical protein
MATAGKGGALEMWLVEMQRTQSGKLLGCGGCERRRNHGRSLGGESKQTERWLPRSESRIMVLVFGVFCCVANAELKFKTLDKFLPGLQKGKSLHFLGNWDEEMRLHGRGDPGWLEGQVSEKDGLGLGKDEEIHPTSHVPRQSPHPNSEDPRLQWSA